MASSVTEVESRDSEKPYDSEMGTKQQQQETAPAARPPGFGAKAKRHCAKWWWLHILIFCVIFLIVALLLVYVGLPRIAQNNVDDSSLELTDLEFLAPTPDTVVLTQKAILHSPSIFTPTLDAFNATLWLVTNGTFAAAPLNMLEMPKIHALHPKSNATVLNQDVALLNQDQIVDYVTQVLTKKTVSTALTGKTILRLGELPSTKINYNTTLAYAGLNGLDGFNVTGARVNASAPTGQPNLKGFAYIPNPSVITVEMGNVTLSLATKDQGIIGNATILEMTLRPGNNTLPMTAIVDQVAVITEMNRSPEGIVDFLVTGTSSVYNGVHIPYYEKALASNALHLSMNIKQVLADSI